MSCKFINNIYECDFVDVTEFAWEYTGFEPPPPSETSKLQIGDEVEIDYNCDRFWVKIVQKDCEVLICQVTGESLDIEHPFHIGDLVKISSLRNIYTIRFKGN
jgi:hypothetical protein